MLELLLTVVLAAPGAALDDSEPVQVMPNVVVISADTLRADHLGMYGHPYDTSPHLDAWAKNALVFDDMICEVPLTSPSFCSMFSSRYPRTTGAIRNGLRLPDEIPTAAQVFQAAGYHTVAVQSNWTLKSELSGLDRGFDIYDDGFHKKRWGFIKSERGANEVRRIALELLEEWDRAKPLFGWFHFSDPHAPYKLHRKFDVAKPSKRDGKPGGKMRRKYDSEIAFMDSRIKAVMDALPKENTFVIFVGDHGESLREHEYVGHGRRIYQTGLHVPLIISGPAIAPGRSTMPARGIDLAPTLFGLAGLSAEAGMAGLDLLSTSIPMNRIRVVETYGGAVPNVPGAKAMMASRPPQRQGALADGWKLILNGSRTELFHLAEDPMEEHDRSAAETERVATLRAVIRLWDQETATTSSQEAELSEDDLDALEALGYLGQ